MFDYVEASTLLCSLVDENRLIDSSEQLIISLLNLLQFGNEDEYELLCSGQIKALILVLANSYLMTCDEVLSKISQGIDVSSSGIKTIYKSQFSGFCKISIVCAN